MARQLKFPPKHGKAAGRTQTAQPVVANPATKPVGRGVWIAPWVGPNGETVLLAITRFRKLVGEPVTIPNGTSHHVACDALWAQLDQEDPTPKLAVLS